MQQKAFYSKKLFFHCPTACRFPSRQIVSPVAEIDAFDTTRQTAPFPEVPIPSEETKKSAYPCGYQTIDGDMK